MRRNNCTTICLVIVMLCSPSVLTSYAQSIQFLPPVKLTYAVPDDHIILNVAVNPEGFLTAFIRPDPFYHETIDYQMDLISPTHECSETTIVLENAGGYCDVLYCASEVSPKGWLNHAGIPQAYVKNQYSYSTWPLTSSSSKIYEDILNGPMISYHYNYCTSDPFIPHSVNCDTWSGGCASDMVYASGKIAYVSAYNDNGSLETRFRDTQNNTYISVDDVYLEMSVIGHTTETTHPLVLTGDDGYINRYTFSKSGLIENVFYDFGDSNFVEVYHCAQKDDLEVAVLYRDNFGVMGWSRIDGLVDMEILESGTHSTDGKDGRNLSWFDLKGNYHAISFIENFYSSENHTEFSISSITIFHRSPEDKWIMIEPSIDYELGDIIDVEFERWNFENPQIVIISDTGNGSFVSQLYFNGTEWEVQEVAPAEPGIEYSDCFTGRCLDDPHIVGWRQTGDVEGYFYRTSKAFTSGQLTSVHHNMWRLYD